MGHIFISYSHKDKTYVHKLQEALQKEGFEVWIDDRIDYGTTWPMVIQRNLDACNAFLVVMTENAYESKWVHNEVTRAERKKKPFFVLLLSGDTWLSFEAIQYENVTGGKLPSRKFYESLARATPRKKKDIQLPPQAPPTADRPSVSESTLVRSFNALKSTPRLLSIAGFTAIVILLFWASSWVVPQILSREPTKQAAAPSLSDTPLLFTKTVLPSVVLTKTFIPTSTISPTSTEPWLAEIVDEAGVEMVLVPAGEFTMGNDNNSPDEKPVRTVYLDSFYIDKYEVSNVSYAICVKKGFCDVPVETDSYTRSSYYGNELYADYPVIHVTWSMANEYCEWRGALLPDEARWEKAARGTDGRIYPWGSNFDPTGANFCDYECAFRWAEKKFNDQHNDTAPVNSYENGRSPYEVYNLSGNVWEWVAGWYFSDYSVTGYKASFMHIKLGATEAPQNQRIVRGGSWQSSSTYLRTSERHAVEADLQDDATGFRCANDANP
ncbi:MAG: TIR domain-containing protein [Chloroflexi bacterium]|nr:MAG: TIR domain-containing protein [Chloroflexota bacterium]